MDYASSRFSKIGLDVFYIYIALVTCINGLVATRQLRGWILGDWLINYEGGFVRRGLAGEIALLLGRSVHITPVFFVVVFYLLLYLLFFMAFRSLASCARKNFWILALIFSPATLSFQVLHRGAGFRKEIIYLAAFTLFVFLLDKGRVTPLFTTGYLTGVLIFSTLCHEGLIFYAPYFVAALLISGRDGKEALKECILPLVLGTIACGLCFSHLGNAAVATKICASIGYKLAAVPGSTEICANGAIPYLAKTQEMASADALYKIKNYQYLWVFPCYFIVALLPAVGESVVLVRSRMSRQVSILWVASAISFIGTLVLFRFAVDWGRWIYIHIVSITVLLIFIENQRRRVSGGHFDAPSDMSAGRKMVRWAFVMVYATFWILPSDTETLRMGYAGRVLETLHVTAKSPNAERIPSSPTTPLGLE